jgi:ribonuclease P protein component
LSGSFGRRERLTGRREFQAVFQQGKRVDRPSLIVRWRESAGARRVGFAVSRQVRNAVRRNRVRRRLREAYRLTRDVAPASVLLVVIGRPSAFGVEFGALVAEMSHAFSMIPGPRAS